MLTRIIAAAVLIALLVALLLIGGIFLEIAVVLAALITEYEIIRAIKKSGTELPEVFLYLYTLLLYPAVKLSGDMMPAILLISFGISGVFVFGILQKENCFEYVSNSLIALIYPQIFFVFLYRAVIYDAQSTSVSIIVSAFATAILTDTMAYFIGTFFGKHKLIPHISPKKSVEGAVAGLVGGVIGLSLSVLLLSEEIFFRNVPVLIFAGLMISAVSQFGDLAASLIKRHYGIKDYGNLIPGHGGLLDRLDSTLFILPFVYSLYKYILKI